MLREPWRVSKVLFKDILTRGKTIHAPHLSLRLAVIPASSTKMAVVVPKKVQAKAHDRNLLRRRIYAIVRQYRDNLPQGFGGLIFAKPQASHLNHSDLQAEVRGLLSNSFGIDL
ncbi:ribonuclease P protein component [Candidatus Parcubacteria bacterium]|nr:ribonuclease P protein component [Candidatus Parcubacteria bacterium]